MTRLSLLIIVNEGVDLCYRCFCSSQANFNLQITVAYCRKPRLHNQHGEWLVFGLCLPSKACVHKNLEDIAGYHEKLSI